MTLYDFLQTKPYSTNVAATSHALTLDNNVVSARSTTPPSALVAVLSYDGTSGDQCSSITDTDGNTWTRGTSTSDGAGVNGEMWYAYNVVGGNKPTITANMSSSVKMTMVVAEVDQIKPVAPLDHTTARIDTTSSTVRRSATTSPGTRAGMVEVTVGGLAWNHASWTTSTPYSGFTDLTVEQNGSSNIGAALNHRSNETKSVSGTYSIAWFTMNSSTTYPAAAMCLTFLREGVVTATTEDGYIDNIEGVATAYTTGSAYLYTSSQSSPNGGTGTSERSTVYSFFPKYAGLTSGATIGESITLSYFVDDGYDDGVGDWKVLLRTSKSGQGASTLTTADEMVVNEHTIDLGVTPYEWGEHTVTLSKAADYNESGYTSTMFLQYPSAVDAEPTSNYAYFKTTDYSGYPLWMELEISYPSYVSQRMLRGIC